MDGNGAIVSPPSSHIVWTRVLLGTSTTNSKSSEYPSRVPVTTIDAATESGSYFHQAGNRRFGTAGVERREGKHCSKPAKNGYLHLSQAGRSRNSARFRARNRAKLSASVFASTIHWSRLRWCCTAGKADEENKDTICRVASVCARCCAKLKSLMRSILDRVSVY